jgi:hypothetical protein
MNLFRDELPTFMGIKVLPSHLVQPVPKIQLSPRFEWCTPSFRSEYNAWLLGRFGTREVAFMFSGPFGEGIFMNPKQIAMLKNVSG